MWRAGFHMRQEPSRDPWRAGVTGPARSMAWAHLIRGDSERSAAAKPPRMGSRRTTAKGDSRGPDWLTRSTARNVRALQLAAVRRFVLLAATGIGGRVMVGMLPGLSSTAIPGQFPLRFRLVSRRTQLQSGRRCPRELVWHAHASPPWAAKRSTGRCHAAGWSVRFLMRRPGALLCCVWSTCSGRQLQAMPLRASLTSSAILPELPLDSATRPVALGHEPTVAAGCQATR